MFNDDYHQSNNRRPQAKSRNEIPRSMKIMMDEARVNSFQFSQLTSNMLRGASLPTNIEMTPKQTMSKRVKPIRPSNASQQTGLRTYNDIVNSGAYNQPDYHPRPIKTCTDREKDRLANIMAYGMDPTKLAHRKVESSPPSSPSPPRQVDRFDELVLEIEQRKQFLDQMTSLGKRKEYQQVIVNEISEKIREMEQIDRQRSQALEQHLKESHQ